MRGPEAVWEDDLHNIGEVYIASGGDVVVAHIGSKLTAMGDVQPVDDDVAELKRRSALSTTRTWGEDS